MKRIHWHVLLFVLTAAPAWPWTAAPANWVKVRQESELIVVGHVVGELTYVAQDQPPGSGFSWEFHGTLHVEETLKGNPPAPEFPFVLAYGLQASRYMRDGRLTISSYEREEDKQRLALYDGGSGTGLMVEDAHQPTIWVLGHWPPNNSLSEPTKEFCAKFPFDVQPKEMLPFFRALVAPDPGPAMIDLLKEPGVRLKWMTLQYLLDAQDNRAYPAVAALLGDKNNGIAYLATQACVKLGGRQAIPALRPFLADSRGPHFATAAQGLAALGDTQSTPRLIGVLQTEHQAYLRKIAARALGAMGDARAVPALIAALKDSGGREEIDGEVWMAARDALMRWAHCWLSPNGDKAQRWWRAAQGLPAGAIEHFAVAQKVASFSQLSPDWQEDYSQEIPSLLGGQRWGTRFSWNMPGEYQVEAVQRYFQELLANEHWHDYQALPSQIDDELRLKDELSDSPDSGKPVYLKYTVTNVSDHDLWLCTSYQEFGAERCANGSGGYGLIGSWGRRELSAFDFIKLPAHACHIFIGPNILLNNPRLKGNLPIVWIKAGLSFDGKGTQFGHDAWVGEVWADPITIPAGPPTKAQ
jgi:hypothetical protein